MRNATDRQLEILEWMRSFQRENHMPPTLREIANEFGFVSTNGVVDHLSSLEAKGLVTHKPMIARGWRAVPPSASEGV